MALLCRCFRGATPGEDVPHGVVALMARVFIDPVILSLAQRYPYFPGFRVHIRIVDGDSVVNRTGVDTREPLDHMQRLALRNALDAQGRRAGADPALAVVIGGVNHQRFALPVATRIPIPLADTRWKMGAPIERNDASFVN